jgi:hypothetical protein
MKKDIKKLLAGLRGPYHPRRPVLMHPPDGLRVFLEPANPIERRLRDWQRCCFCRRSFRVPALEDSRVPILTCSTDCSAHALSRKPPAPRAPRLKGDAARRANAAWRDWLSRSEA